MPLSAVEDILMQQHFEKVRSNERQTIYSKDNAMTAVVTRIFCAHAERSQNPAEYCRANQDLFITPGLGIKTCMNTTEGIPIFEAVHSRDIKRVSHQFMLAISKMGRHCNQRKD